MPKSIVVDDELKPDVAVTRARGLIERDDVHFVVGPIFSNVAQAIQRPIVRGRPDPDQFECRPVGPGR